MNPFEKISSVLSSGMNAQAYRLQVVSENLANVDTHGYRRKLVTFAAAFDRGAEAPRVDVRSVMLDPKPGEKRLEPTHPLADEDGYLTLSNVNAMIEMADAREARRTYDAGLEAFRQARQMYASLLDVLRR